MVYTFPNSSIHCSKQMFYSFCSSVHTHTLAHMLLQILRITEMMS